mmetsp:Transcript_57847/g.181647  ORF Transcript_57847/g.181647 Transcript_57847/m.181647 type:complete len:248 (-) Transcript_57847:49-792(-)
MPPVAARGASGRQRQVAHEEGRGGARRARERLRVGAARREQEVLVEEPRDALAAAVRAHLEVEARRAVRVLEQRLGPPHAARQRVHLRLVPARRRLPRRPSGGKVLGRQERAKNKERRVDGGELSVAAAGLVAPVQHEAVGTGSYTSRCRDRLRRGAQRVLEGVQPALDADAKYNEAKAGRRKRAVAGGSVVVERYLVQVQATGSAEGTKAADALVEEAFHAAQTMPAVLLAVVGIGWQVCRLDQAR